MGQPINNQKAAFYGQFVQAAYAMYKNPQSPDPLRPAPSGIPAGYELGAWIHMSDFFLDVVQPKFYGIVAHETNNPNSRVIAVRGTEGALEWLDDAAAIPVPFREVPSAGRVAFGFDRIYTTMKIVPCPHPGTAATAAFTAPQTLTGSFANQLEQLALIREAERGIAPATEGRPRPVRPVVVTGHSLGAALTTLFVMENDSTRKFDIDTLCTFASPRVGNMAFVERFNQLPINSWRIANKNDLVPKLPLHLPVLFDYGHVDTLTSFDSSKFAKNNLVCNHSMDTYLHALDSSVAPVPDCVLQPSAIAISPADAAGTYPVNVSPETLRP
jgi:hypothetical protein